MLCGVISEFLFVPLPYFNFNTMAPNSNITGDDLVITSITARDMRWPTSLGGHGSDAMVHF